MYSLEVVAQFGFVCFLFGLCIESFITFVLTIIVKRKLIKNNKVDKDISCSEEVNDAEKAS